MVTFNNTKKCKINWKVWKLNEQLSNESVHQKKMYIFAIYQSLKSDSQLPKKIDFSCFSGRPLKVMKNIFYFMLKALLFLRCLYVCPHSFDHVEKQFDKSAKVTLIICDVTDWETNNHNKHIAQYLKYLKNIWKIIHKMWWRS